KALKATPNPFVTKTNTTYQEAALIDQWKTITKLLYPANLNTVVPSTDEIIKQGAE
ncbi:MAG: hypothetical protein L6R42_009415, partial [Xanthoria sp. 1 TBL-2021]